MDQRDAVKRSIQFAEAQEEARRNPFGMTGEERAAGGVRAALWAVALVCIPLGLLLALGALLL